MIANIGGLGYLTHLLNNVPKKLNLIEKLQKKS